MARWPLPVPLALALLTGPLRLWPSPPHDEGRPVGARITGRVIDASGAAIPGATVVAVPANGEAAATRALTRADGTYELDGSVEGPYFVDFELTGFDLVRRNNIRATANALGHADAVLYVSAICECVSITPKAPLRERIGQVLSASGQPLPHARLKIDSPRPESALATAEGRFAIRVPLDEPVSLTASESGFQSATQQVSGGSDAIVVFRLAPAAGARARDTERLRGPCCPGDFFAQGR